MDEIIDDYGVSEAPVVYDIPVDDQHELETKQEKTMVLGASPLKEVIMEWFDSEILWARSIDGLDPGEINLADQIMAKQRIYKFMTEAKDRLDGLFNEHLPK